MPEKEKWQSPELIVLVRSKPEEAILSGCKHGGQPPGGSPNDQAMACYIGAAACALCEPFRAS